MFDYITLLENVQAVPIKVAVKIIRLKVCIIFSQSDDLDLHSRSQLLLKRQCFNLYYNSNYLGQYLSYGIPTWHDDRLMYGMYAHARFDDLGLDARSQWVGRGRNSALNYLDN